MATKDYYAIFEITRDEPQANIKGKYHVLIHAWHPDKFPAELKQVAGEKTTLINEAYSILSNPTKRAAYDREWAQTQPSSEPQENQQKSKTAGQTPRSPLSRQQEQAKPERISRENEAYTTSHHAQAQEGASRRRKQEEKAR